MKYESTKAGSRRHFLTSSAVGSAAVASASLTGRLPRLTAQEVQSARVLSDSGIESLVHMFETTGRNELLGVVAERIKQGTSYQQILAALQLSAVRNVQPRPAVGFKFHSVLVVNSAHLASMAGPDHDRWLPILWAIDYFKRTQADEKSQSGWTMEAVDESRLPAPSVAREQFVQAMQSWDAPLADRAIAQLCRTASINELFDLFCYFGARDFRSIGHKAIFVANAFRTLHVIGWQHAQPILRSLAFALQNHTGESNPSSSDHEADRPWRHNRELQSQLREDWLFGNDSQTAVRELVAAFRSASAIEVSNAVASAINNGLSAQSAWDSIFLAAGELLMQQPGIIGLHSLTTANALHYAYQACGDDGTRQLMLLQAAAFLPMFRAAARDRGDLSAQTAEGLLASGASVERVEQVFENLHRDRSEAATRLYGFLEAGGSPYAALDEARRLIFLKGSDAHDYKFSSAVLEDYHNVSPQFRNEFLALSVFNLKGSGHGDNGLVERIRTVLG